MDRCPICGTTLTSDSCTQAACIQIELRIEQIETEYAAA